MAPMIHGAAPKPLNIQEQGSFAVGGTVIKTEGVFDPRSPFEPAGQTLHGDHAYVFYQKPVAARTLPLVFLHGAGSSGKVWESTADGREGFQNIFLRRNFSVYLVDQPRRGKAGRSTVGETLAPNTDDLLWFTQFRIGAGLNFYPGVQFPQDQDSLNQFFRQSTPNTGPFDMGVISDALAALFAKEGPGILLTHSQGGGPGWVTGIKSQNVKAIVSYEPGSNFAFPQSATPPPIENKFATLNPATVSDEDFKKLTLMPIIIYYGDNIPKEPSDIPALDYWRACLEMARQWAKTVNDHGGDATVIHLPEIGINGNTHFPFSDLNNLEIADHLSAWLHDKKLD
ncbi:MAG: alpha/beta hydrolase [Candidatus Adiutrix sp.]